MYFFDSVGKFISEEGQDFLRTFHLDDPSAHFWLYWGNPKEKMCTGKNNTEKIVS